MSITAMKQALAYMDGTLKTDHVTGYDRKQWVMHNLRTAIEQAEKQEPFGFMNPGHVYEMQQGRLPYGYVYPKAGTGADVAVYTTPPAAQRQWVSLTDRERDQFFKYVNMTDLVKAIEAKLREKNT